MKSYFINLLQQLDKLTGIRQWEKLKEAVDPNEEIKLLVAILCRTCDLFPYIPDEAKQKIITACVVSDQEFIGLNAKIIYKWLNANKDQYFRETSHIPTEKNEPPVEGEARAEWIKKFLIAINTVDEHVTVTNNFDQFEHVKEIKPTDGQAYHAAPPETIIIQDLKIDYGRLHTDKFTGKTLQGHPTFDEFVDAWVNEHIEPDQQT
jgi:hypothetical protein